MHLKRDASDLTPTNLGRRSSLMISTDWLVQYSAKRSPTNSASIFLPPLDSDSQSGYQDQYAINTPQLLRSGFKRLQRFFRGNARPKSPIVRFWYIARGLNLQVIGQHNHLRPKCLQKLTDFLKNRSESRGSNRCGVIQTIHIPLGSMPRPIARKCPTSPFQLAGQSGYREKNTSGKLTTADHRKEYFFPACPRCNISSTSG
ncbi:hypothetical protein CCUS01_10002 [Colletotrichum cuscutae]|uniref:Uncharacterized protein n=1 Tax=Colletotrichum cuscutae TaxID=1209917 RepID=A0AAI9XQK4_9PEZI|nr:hypothetical protein CCUS01_10002 [Colletotrichum cuscutae]